MKAQRGQIEKALAAPQPEQRLFLLHGPDESGSRDLAARLAKAMGSEAERIDLTGPALKADPARLADEAASMSLFGGARFIRIDPAGDEILEAVQALLDAPPGGNPVVAIAGALRKESKLLKLALASSQILAFASYAPEGNEADRLAIAMARDMGLRIHADIARRLADATSGDRGLLARELEKLALFADAAPDRPGEIDGDALDALGAATDEGDLSRLVDAVLGGRADGAEAELTRLSGEAIEGIPVIRALLRRLLLLAAMRAEADRTSPDAAPVSPGKPLFWKDKESISQQLARWTPTALETAIRRLAAAERLVKAPGCPGEAVVDEELLAISRAAARMR